MEPYEPKQEERSGWNPVDPNAKIETVVIDPEVPILDEEPDVSAGVGAALKLAMSKGYLEKEEKNRPSNSRLAHLQVLNHFIIILCVWYLPPPLVMYEDSIRNTRLKKKTIKLRKNIFTSLHSRFLSPHIFASNVQ